METSFTYIVLFCLIAILGQIFEKSIVPLSLILLVTGIVLSFIPYFPTVELKPSVVLNVFLPILIYQISAFTSLRDIKNNLLPITLLSIGHVIFITILVAVIIHYILPELGWPLAFLLGAVISPPDDVAIVSIAEKIHLPRKIITILEGEAIFNDATALILFRFALAATLTHQFSFIQASTNYFIFMITETVYGFFIGYMLGELRARMKNTNLHMIVSILTPFIAYLPMEYLGASGILATAIAGFMIGNYYSIRFTPEFRLMSVATWPTIGFAIQGLLFILVGLNLKSTVQNVGMISFGDLLSLSLVILATVVIGRFIWVYGVIGLIEKLIALKTKKSKKGWLYPFIISWAGMRGAISLAAALAVPPLPYFIHGAPVNSLLLFLVVCVILFTLCIQGFSLPFILNKLGISSFGSKEVFKEHLSELKARLAMIKAALRTLKEYKKTLKEDDATQEEVKLYIQEYTMIKKYLKESIEDHNLCLGHDEEKEIEREIFLLQQIVYAQKEVILDLWRNEKINLKSRNRLMTRLDHQLQQRKS